MLSTITPCLRRKGEELMRSFLPIPCGLATASAIPSLWSNSTPPTAITPGHWSQIYVDVLTSNSEKWYHLHFRRGKKRYKTHLKKKSRVVCEAQTFIVVNTSYPSPITRLCRGCKCPYSSNRQPVHSHLLYIASQLTWHSSQRNDQVIFPF